MIIEVDRAAGELHKRAETAEEAARLRREAEILAVARHPGVVELRRADATELTLRLVDAEPLSAATAEIGVAVATTLADLHDLGVVHGALRSDHILVDRSGRPTLCSFGRGAIDAGAGAGAAGAGGARDVVALARTLLAKTTTTADASARRILTGAARAGRNAPSARELATLLAGPPRSRRLPRAIAVAAPVALGAAGVMAVIALVPARHRAGVDRGPAVDQGCQPLHRRDGIVDAPSGRFRIGRPDDVVVVGRWQCGPALPALLRPATAEVWVWDTWARPSAVVSARLVGRIPDAVSLRVEPEARGCDGLRVLRRAGAAVVIHPDRPT
ncbi:MAG: eukaryotic-like serine/threonine-protein kinase [Acidimicrobiaceae bacterium]|nr:eukaryotic-like serine/threonine-protein kinase [Acidimicrobiaceae bacterium]